jgi:hypothetical protein
MEPSAAIKNCGGAEAAATTRGCTLVARGSGPGRPCAAAKGEPQPRDLSPIMATTGSAGKGP